MLSVAKRDPTEDELIDWLSDEINFLRDCTSLEGHVEGMATEPYDYQIDFILGEELFRADLKSRQIGWSAAVAMRAFIRSQMFHYSRGGVPHTSIFTSMSLADDREKMRYVRMLQESLPPEFKKRLITDNTFEMEFDNGSRIVCMHKPRGKGPADVYIDEEAYIQDIAGVRTGAVGVITRGGTVRVGGTPAGRQGWLFDLFDPGNEEKYSEWTRCKIFWWDCPDLCTNVERARREAPAMPTDDRVDLFGTPVLKEIRQTLTLEDFQQEYECVFVDDLKSYFPYALLLSCVDRDLETFDTFEAFGAAKTGTVFGGYDVGRTRNLSVLAGWEKLGSRAYCRADRVLEKTPFKVQEQTICDFMDYTNPAKFRIDRNGIGMQLAEELSDKTRYGRLVEGVNFTNEEKASMCELAHRELECRNLILPPGRDRLRHWHAIRRETLPAGKFRYAAPQSDEHHADIAWADMLAISGAFRKYKRRRGGVKTGEPR